MKILIVDDEKLARQRVIKLIRELHPGAKLSEASTGEEAIFAMNNEAFNLVFLDIQLTDMTGFDVLQNRTTTSAPVLIFVTAYDQFAIQAFEVQAMDYLLKPFSNARFRDTWERAIKQIQNQNKADASERIDQLLKQVQPATLKNHIDKFPIRRNNKYYFVSCQDIQYIKSAAYYAELHTLDEKKHLYRISLSELIQKLNPDQFIRISRSTIVCIEAIQEVQSEGGGDYAIQMKNGKAFSLSKSYRPAFLKKLDIR